MTTISADTVPEAWTLACTVSVLRALEAAGKRGRLSRTLIGRLKAEDVPAWEVHLHVRLAPRSQDCGRLLAAVWDLLSTALPDGRRSVDVVEACHDYVVWLLVTKRRFDPDDLRRYLAGDRDRLPA